MIDLSRQQGLVPESLSEKNIAVVGCGAVGRQVAMLLAAAGATRVTLVDPDIVEEPNVCTQLYPRADIGIPKVMATQGEMRRISSFVKTDTIYDRWRRSYTEGMDVIFCCVDSMAVRQKIFESLGDDTIMIDSRTSGQTAYVLPVTPELRSKYAETLFPDNEAHRGSCTQQATGFVSYSVAATAVYQYTRCLLNQASDRL